MTHDLKQESFELDKHIGLLYLMLKLEIGRMRATRIKLMTTVKKNSYTMSRDNFHKQGLLDHFSNQFRRKE